MRGTNCRRKRRQVQTFTEYHCFLWVSQMGILFGNLNVLLYPADLTQLRLDTDTGCFCQLYHLPGISQILLERL
jgi:hypothetical protein